LKERVKSSRREVYKGILNNSRSPIPSSEFL